jgi:adenosine deaminase CECR1
LHVATSFQSLKAARGHLTDYPQRTLETQLQVVALRGAPDSVTLLDHILAVVAAIIAPMKKRLLRKRKKISSPRMDDLNGDTKMVDVENHVILDPAQTFTQSLANVGVAETGYEKNKKELIKKEDNTAWDHAAQQSATEAEKKAGEIIWKIREDERDNLFGNKASEAIPGPETLDMGGQFLTNKERIEKGSVLYKIAKKLPKGCHLHLHFNAELSPYDLITKSKKIPNMFIRSTEPLLKDQSYATCELVFNVMPEDTPEADIWSPDYKPDFRSPEARPWMKWSKFIKEFKIRRGEDAQEFIMSKMILSEEEVYGNSQTTNG